jgi:hypothetical protein
VLKLIVNYLGTLIRVSFYTYASPHHLLILLSFRFFFIVSHNFDEFFSPLFLSRERGSADQYDNFSFWACSESPKLVDLNRSIRRFSAIGSTSLKRYSISLFVFDFLLFISKIYSSTFS